LHEEYLNRENFEVLGWNLRIRRSWSALPESGAKAKAVNGIRIASGGSMWRYLTGLRLIGGNKKYIYIYRKFFETCIVWDADRYNCILAP